MKRCPRCGRTKRAELFYSNTAQRDGLSCWCKACDKRAKKRSYDSGTRRTWRFAQYGLTVEEVEQMISEQGGKCAVCREREAECIDHDHSTGEVRGMLCHFCNRGIGFLGDTHAALLRAVEYLSCA